MLDHTDDVDIHVIDVSHRQKVYTLALTSKAHVGDADTRAEELARGFQGHLNEDHARHLGAT